VAIRISDDDDDDVDDVAGIYLYTARRAGELRSDITIVGWLGVMTQPFCIITCDLLRYSYQKSDLNYFISFFDPSFPFFFPATAENITLEVPAAPRLNAFNSNRPKPLLPQ
jgi:hypothetical protein